MAQPSRRAQEISPMEIEVGVDLSFNHSRPIEAPFFMEDNFPSEYEQKIRPKRFCSEFDRISLVKLRYRQPQLPTVHHNRPQSHLT